MKRIRRDSAFTLIELLMVIAVMTILAWILLPQMNTVRKNALCRKTSGLFNQISVACALYHEDMGLYPPDQKSDGTADGNNQLYRALTCDYWGPSGKGTPSDGVTTNEEIADHWRSIGLVEQNKFGGRQYLELESGLRRVMDGVYKIVDAWGSEIGYDQTELLDSPPTTPYTTSFTAQDGLKSYRTSTSGGPSSFCTLYDPRKAPDVASEPRHNVSFDLFSAGPDGSSFPPHDVNGDSTPDEAFASAFTVKCVSCSNLAHYNIYHCLVHHGMDNNDGIQNWK